jgi:hypothetical protein
VHGAKYALVVTMEEKGKSNSFIYVFIAFAVMVLLFTSSTMLVGYFLSESIFNNNRWLSFGISLVVSLLLMFLLKETNRALSLGEYGAKMQFFRAGRFTLSFSFLVCGALIAALVVFLIDDVSSFTAATKSYGSLAGLLVSLCGIFDFFYVYYLFLGRGVSRV